jgi:hypothetical protein
MVALGGSKNTSSEEGDALDVEGEVIPFFFISVFL